MFRAKVRDKVRSVLIYLLILTILMPSSNLFDIFQITSVYADALPVNVNPTDDTHVWDSSPTTTYGSETFLRIKDGNANLNRESYMKFDLSTFNSIREAKLNIYAKIAESTATATTQTDIKIHKLDDDNWDESDTTTNIPTPTWNTKFSLDANNLLATQTITDGTAYHWYQIDVTDFVKLQLQGDKKAGFGFTQDLNNAGLQVYIKSNNTTTQSERPYLSILNNELPTFDFVQPDNTNPLADNQFTIKWTDTDSDDNASVSLYYDSDNTGQDGTLIVDNLFEDADGAGDEYIWNTTGLANGNYYIYAIINDNLSTPVHKYSPGYISLTHPQATGLSPEDDTYVWDSNPTSSYGTDTYLKIKDGSANYDRESYVKFNLSTYNSVASAKLNIYAKIAETSADANTTTDMKVFLVDDDNWDDDSNSATLTPTWNTKLTLNTNNPVTQTITDGTAYHWYQIDVTNLIKPQVEGGDKIATLALVQQLNNAGKQIYIASKDNATEANRIFLTVEQGTVDTTPDEVIFTEISNGLKNTEYTSNTVTIKNFQGTLNVNLTGGNNSKIIKNGTDAGTTTTVVENDTLAIRSTSSSNDNETTTMNLSFGTPGAAWKITTVPIENLPSVPGDVAGYTSGNFNIDNAGAANYSIPITVSPGTSGMQPKLSLNYTSRSGNGMAGIGWGLSGLSTITRCSATLGQDGFIDGVDFDGNDKYCLDGERLRALDGQTYGADGTEYRTEHETFSKIFSRGISGDGPAQFQVYTKSGLYMEFGYTGDSRIEATGTQNVLFWAVNRVMDTLGNYMTITYSENNSFIEYYPQRIDYTGNLHPNLNVAPYNYVTFEYENRDDDVPSYINGHLLKVSKRLKTIKSFYAYNNNPILAKEYRLGYQYGTASTLSHLNSFTECGSDGTCFAPTSFEWKSFANENFNFTAENSGLDWHANNLNQGGLQKNRVGDFNGDGKMDIAGYAGGTSTPDLDKWRVTLSNGIGFHDYGSLYWDGVNGGNDLKNVFLGDFNGDGKTDMLKQADQVAQDKWRVKVSNGLGLIYQEGIDRLWNGHSEGFDDTIVADFNGDGLTDIAGYKNDTVNKDYWRVCLNVLISGGNDFNCDAVPNQPYWNGHSGGVSNNFLGDFNGDGMVDMMKYADPAVAAENQGKFRVKLSTGTNFTDAGLWQSPNTDVNIANTFLGDFNGDGKTDVLGYTNNGNWNVCISTGVNFICNIWAGHAGGQNNNFVGDFNGDGKSDIAGYTQSSGLWHVSLSSGKNFFSPANGQFWSGHTDSSSKNLIGDFNGDGSTDMAAFTYNGDNWHVTLSNVSTPDLMLRIVNGHSTEIKINYGPINNLNIHTKDNDASFPTRVDYAGPLYVVSNYEITNGIGGYNKYTYSYKGAEFNTRGRGFRGFRKIQVKDEQSKITTATYFGLTSAEIPNNPYGVANHEQSHIWGGLPLKVEQTLENGNFLSTTQYILGVNIIGQNLVNERYFSYVRSSTTKTYEPSNNSLIKTVKTDNFYDQYGSITEIDTYTDVDGTLNQSNTFKEVVKNTYTNDTVNWRLARLVTTESTKYLPSGTSQKKTSVFTYNQATSQLETETIEPNTANQVVKTYEHDLFGNIVKSTVGTGNDARVQTTVYGGLGRFAKENINALNQKQINNYELLLGNLIDTTDPDGKKTTFQYDQFGRTILKVNPDGTRVQTSYKLCNSSTNCNFPNAKYFIRVDQSGAKPQFKYFDILDREIGTITSGFDGRNVITNVEYNNLGQVIKKCLPYYFDNPNPDCTVYTYDLAGRTISETMGSYVTTYNYNGLTTSTTNPKNQITTSIKNVNGQIIQNKDADNNALNFKYNANGDLIETKDPANNVIATQFNSLGYKISSTDPDAGTISYQYNIFGELISQTDAKNLTTTYQYDKLGRIIQRHSNEGDVIWEYDTKVNGVGKLSKVTNYDGYIEEYHYDKLGRNYEILRKFDNEIYPESYTFDQYGRGKSVTYPTGFAVKNNFNENGFLSEIKNANSEAKIWSALQINAKGQMKEETFGNNLSTRYEYKDAYYIDSIKTGNASNSQNVQNLKFKFDLAGNLIEREDLEQPVKEVLEYDNLNRLTKSTVGSQVVTITYDVTGNILTKSDVGTYIYGSSKPHAVTNITGSVNSTFSYDANGNRELGNGLNILYTTFNKVKQINKSSTVVEDYFYNQNYSKYKSALNSNNTLSSTIYAGNLYEKKITGNTTTHSHYIYVNNKIVAIYTKENTQANMRYVHTDHLGSVDAITDENANRVERVSFDAWGNKRNPLTWQSIQTPTINFTKKGFTGHEQLTEFGLVNMKGRIYDPTIARFISADPFIQSPGNLQNYNRYTYVMNNPLSFTDPSGYIFKWVADKFEDAIDFFKDTVIPFIVGTVGAVIGFAIGGPVGAAAGFGFGSSFAGTLINGGSLGDAFRAGLISGVIASAFNFPPGIQGALVSGFVGGVESVLNGGKFQHGFISGVAKQIISEVSTGIFSEGENPVINDSVNTTETIDSTTASTTAGTLSGTLSETDGGKFANGAVTESFEKTVSSPKSEYSKILKPKKMTLKELSDKLGSAEKVTSLIGKRSSIFNEFIGKPMKKFSFAVNAVDVIRTPNVGKVLDLTVAAVGNIPIIKPFALSYESVRFAGSLAVDYIENGEHGAEMAEQILNARDYLFR